MHYTSDQKRLLWEAGLRAVFENLTVIFVTAFALALGASHLVVGLLSALPFFAALFGELFGGFLVSKINRKTISIVFALMGYGLWIAVAGVPVLGTLAIPAFGVLYVTITFLLQMTLPAWISWISELVSEKIRGRFFSYRNKIMHSVAFFALLFSGWYLDLFSENSTIGFSAIFIVGAIFGLLSVRSYMAIQKPAKIEEPFSLKQYWSISPGLKGYVMVSVLFYIAVSIPAPFFSAFLLENLHMSYMAYVAVNALTLLTKVITSPTWGKLSDKFGDRNVFVVGSIGIALVPVLYALSGVISPWFMFFVAIYTGWVWAGVDLALFNLFLGYSSPKTRAIETATYNAIISVPQMIFPLIGGYLADHASVFGLKGIPLVFAISMVARFLVVIPITRLKEPRPVGESRLSDLFHAVIHYSGIHGLRGSHRWMNLLVGVHHSRKSKALAKN